MNRETRGARLVRGRYETEREKMDERGCSADRVAATKELGQPMTFLQ